MTRFTRQNTISKNPKLQDDIDRNLNLREGAARILNVAGNTIQRLDAAKTILVTNARLVVSMRQLQLEKFNEITSSTLTAGTNIEVSSFTNKRKRFCTGEATLCLSGIRIPLLWKDTSLTPNASAALSRLLDPSYERTLANLGGAYSYSTLSRHQRPLSLVLSSMGNTNNESAGEWCSAFCIVRIGDQIQETRLLCEVRPGTSDLEFDDVLIFENVRPDFECTIELYGYQSTDQGSMSFLRRKSQMDNGSLSHRNSVFLGTLTPEYTKDSKTGLRVSVPASSPAFECCFTLVARYTAKLADLGSEVTAHQLELVSSQNLNPSLSHLFFSASSSASNGNSNSSVSTLLSTVSAFPTNEDSLPLFGPICFSLTAQPDSVHKPVYSGFLWIRDTTEESVSNQARVYFCELRNQRLYARAVKPSERKSIMTSAKSESISLDGSLSDFQLGKSKTGQSRKPQFNWDKIVKIDPSTKFLDDEPVFREFPLFLKSLTVEERENLLGSMKLIKEDEKESSPQIKLRRSLSLGGFVIPPIAASSPVEGVDVMTVRVESSDLSSSEGKENNTNGTLNFSKASSLLRIRSLNEVQKALPISSSIAHNLTKKMPTLRLSSQLCVKNQDSCRLEEEENAVKDCEKEVILELGAFDSLFSINECRDTECDGPISEWICAMKDHIEEQEKWGVESFGQEVYIPEATSLTKHGTIIRPTTIPKVPTDSLEALDRPLEESSISPVTVF